MKKAIKILVAIVSAVATIAVGILIFENICRRTEDIIEN